MDQQGKEWKSCKALLNQHLEDYFRNRWSSFEELSLPDQSNDYPSENQSDAGRSAKAKEELEKREISSLRIWCCVEVSSEIISSKFKYLGIWKQFFW